MFLCCWIIFMKILCTMMIEAHTPHIIIIIHITEIIHVLFCNMWSFEIMCWVIVYLPNIQHIYVYFKRRWWAFRFGGTQNVNFSIMTKSDIIVFNVRFWYDEFKECWCQFKLIKKNFFYSISTLLSNEIWIVCALIVSWSAWKMLRIFFVGLWLMIIRDCS